MYSEEKHDVWRKAKPAKCTTRLPWSDSDQLRGAQRDGRKEKQMLTQHSAESNTAFGKILLFTDSQHHCCTAPALIGHLF